VNENRRRRVSLEEQLHPKAAGEADRDEFERQAYDMSIRQQEQAARFRQRRSPEAHDESTVHTARRAAVACKPFVLSICDQCLETGGSRHAAKQRAGDSRERFTWQGRGARWDAWHHAP
jgi:hypothetical protein